MSKFLAFRVEQDLLVLFRTMGNCVARADDYVIPQNHEKWMAKCRQEVVRGLLDCDKRNRMASNSEYSATDTAMYCHKSLYGRCFDPCFPLPTEQKVIGPKIVANLAVGRKSSKRTVVAPDTVPELPTVGKQRNGRQPGVKTVRSAKEKKEESKSAANLNVYVVTWNMNGKVRHSFH